MPSVDAFWFAPGALADVRDVAVNIATLLIGLADFAEPTLLILGNSASMYWLAEQVESADSIDFADAPNAKLVNVQLLLERTGESGVLVRDRSRFVWKLSAVDAAEIATKLRCLARGGVPAHAYLDLTTNSAYVEVIASINEYSDAVFVTPRPF
jgi:hypothetical protein